jgi:hypothetical protein
MKMRGPKPATIKNATKAKATSHFLSFFTVLFIVIAVS